jgi:hypothetical protein
MLGSASGSGGASPSTSTSQAAISWAPACASVRRARALDTWRSGVEATCSVSQPPVSPAPVIAIGDRAAP